MGVHAETAQGAVEIRAPLTVAADGRGSRMRAEAGLKVRDLGAPIDVLWFRLSRPDSDTEETQGRFDAGQIFIMLNRGDYWQCAYVVRKGGFEEKKAEGLAAFRAELARIAPFGADRAGELESWDQVKMLSVQVNRLETWWRPGLLCIGDAAHAMSPVGGVGVNLAVQDAVAAANLLAGPLRQGGTAPDLAAVQRRREWPTRATQRLQVLVQNRVLLAGAGQQVDLSCAARPAHDDGGPRPQGSPGPDRRTGAAAGASGPGALPVRRARKDARG